jgi:hypothetical protein
MDPQVREVLCGLATLSDEERTVLQLVVVEGFQYAEVATPGPEIVIAKMRGNRCSP